METDVIIIGAGPTGLMAANQLARFNVNYIILDKKSGPTIESRAIAVTTRSMEIYQQMGLIDTLLQEGTKINSFAVYSEGKQKANINIDEVGTGLTEFNFLLAFEQSKNEELLYKNLKNSGGEVLWNCELLKVSQENSGVTVTVGPNDAQKTIRAKYLIAADGARSLVRHALAFKFEGGTYQNKFFVADTELQWDLPYDRITIFPSRHNFCAFFPLKGTRTIRILGTLPKTSAEDENIDFNKLEVVVKNTIKVPVNFTKIKWFSVYHLHHRMVDNFRNSNIFLAGDSAHIHSPAGGQGMNTGLQDAYNIAWKLAFVLQGKANEKILQTYNEERLPFAKWLLNFTDRMFNMMTNDSWFVFIIRKYLVMNVFPFVVSLQSTKLRVFKMFSQTWYSYSGKKMSINFSDQKLNFTAGDRFPFLINSLNGKSFYELLTGPCFHLVIIGKTEFKETENYFPFGVNIVRSGLTDAWIKTGVTKPLFILVRPDNYIAFISDKLNKEIVNTYFQKTGLFNRN